MTADAIDIRWPWGRRRTDRLTDALTAQAQAPAAQQAPPDPPPATGAELTVRMVAVEETLRLLFEDRKKQADRIARQDARITQQDRTIAQLQEQNRLQQEQNNRLEASITARVGEIGQLEGRLRTSEEGRKEQGARLGNLEKQVAYLPTYRHIVTNAITIIRVWERYSEGLRALLRQAGIPHAEPPDLPELPPLPEVQSDG